MHNYLRATIKVYTNYTKSHADCIHGRTIPIRTQTRVMHSEKQRPQSYTAVAVLLFMFIIQLSPAALAEGWQETLESNFDIAETFDELQDWKGVVIRGVDYDKSHMPLKLDGSQSMWDMYDYWSLAASTTNWIADHGTDKVWRGAGKSLMLDLSQNITSVRKGPSRFGLYFGSNERGVANAYALSGTKDSGYRDFYYFYFAKFPTNHFPRDGNGQFIYFGYYKFNTYDCGFLNISTPFNAAARDEYGPSHILNTWKTGSSYNYDMIFTYGYRVNSVEDDSSLLYEAYPCTGNGALSGIKRFIDNNEWFALEVHQTVGTPGNSDAVTEVWLYDSTGTVRKVLTKTDGWVIEGGQDYSYNKFFFGGNQDFVSEAGLDTSYVIDDFIMDDQPIGPTYFALLNNQPLPLVIGSSLPNAVLNSIYSSTITVQGGTAPYSMSITSGRLPEDLILNGTSGNITGIPRESGSFPFTMEVIDSTAPANTASRQFNLLVTDNSNQTTPSPPSRLQVK